MSDIHNPDRSGYSPPGTGYDITWDEELLWTGIPDPGTGWEDEDIDGKVGPALLILKIVGGNDGGGNDAIWVAEGGASAIGSNRSSGSAVYTSFTTASPDAVGYAVVPTDVAGKVSVGGGSAMGTVWIYRIGYVRCPMPRSVWHTPALPTSWQDWAIGIPDALVVVRVVVGGATTVSLREKGEASEITNQEGLGGATSLNATTFGYLIAKTNADGELQLIAAPAREAWLTIVAYIPLKDLAHLTLASGASPAAWTDLDTTLSGRRLLLVRSISNNDQGWVQARRSEDSALAADEGYGMMNIPAGNGTFQTGLWLTGETGHLDWRESNLVETVTVTKYASVR